VFDDHGDLRQVPGQISFRLDGQFQRTSRLEALNRIDGEENRLQIIEDGAEVGSEDSWIVLEDNAEGITTDLDSVGDDGTEEEY
jgi:hypothetical protein